MDKRNSDPTLGEIIQNQIDNAIAGIPQPLNCKIIKNYPNDLAHVDVELENGTITKTVPLIGNNTIGLTGVLVFINGNPDKKIVITSDSLVYQKLGLNQDVAKKFNFAMIEKQKGTVTYSEFWILSNAYYDYDVKRFVKVNKESNSFGIQLQAEGSYPGEQELGYTDNTSIGVWRHPKVSAIYKDTTTYDYSDLDNKGHIGAKLKSTGEWIEFGISAGWNNSFMMDSYGGMTIGGAGFEIDGNGIYPYTRLTSSVYSVDGVSYYLLGLLDNAYHPTFGNDSVWGCDDNGTYSWFVGLKIPEASYLRKDNANATFVVMYNDTTPDPTNPHVLDKESWHIVFEVGTNGITIPTG